MIELDSPAEYAKAIRTARNSLVDLVGRCSSSDWQALLTTDGDDRSVGVIFDHVAHAYEYIGGWITELLSGTSPKVSPAIVDGLNERHTIGAAGVTPEQAIDHLTRAGDQLLGLVASMRPEHLALGDGQLHRFLGISIRHAQDHGAEIEATIGATAS